MRSGSGGDYATRVVHLRLLRASGKLGWGALRPRRPCAAELAGAARSGFSRGYSLTKLAQKGPEEVWKLTGGAGRSGSQRRGLTV